MPQETNKIPELLNRIDQLPDCKYANNINLLEVVAVIRSIYPDITHKELVATLSEYKRDSTSTRGRTVLIFSTFLDQVTVETPRTDAKKLARRWSRENREVMQGLCVIGAMGCMIVAFVSQVIFRQDQIALHFYSWMVACIILTCVLGINKIPLYNPLALHKLKVEAGRFLSAVKQSSERHDDDR